MGERKVLNKYYPPDFDPEKVPRVKKPKNQQITVRMMLPMSMRCKTCGNYLYLGTKFNMRKEDCIEIFRFYFKCTKCSAELTMRTNPKNSDYIVESGALQNFEPWRDEEERLDRKRQKREDEEVGDAMKSLENRTSDSKRERDIMAALDEMKSMKSRHATVSVDAMLVALHKSSENKEKKLDEEDEALIKSIVFDEQKVPFRNLTNALRTARSANKVQNKYIVTEKKKPDNHGCESKSNIKEAKKRLQSLCDYGDSDDDED